MSEWHIITACLPVWQSVCFLCCALYLSTPTSETCPTFRPTSPHFPPFTSFILFQNPPASWEVCIWVRDVLWMESSPDSGRTHNPHRYSLHTLCDIYFDCDFFSPLVPSLCVTCLPSLNQYGLLDNFTRALMPKGTPERERAQLLAPLLISSLGPLRRLSKLCRDVSLTLTTVLVPYNCFTGGYTPMHGTSLWISHVLLFGSFIKFSLSDCATPLHSDCLSTSSSLAAFLSLFFAHPHTCTISLLLSLTHTYTAQPTQQWVARLYEYWNSGTIRVPAESTFHFAMPSSQDNCSSFSTITAIALESLLLFIQKWHIIFFFKASI